MATLGQISNGLISFMILASLCSCQTAQQAAQDYATLDDSHFRNTIAVTNDPLDTVVTFSTQTGY